MTKKLSRRKFILTSAAATVVTSTSSFPKPSIAKGIRKWRMVMTWQKLLPGIGTGAVRLAKRINSLSDGKLEIITYGGGELVPALEVFDAVAQGTAEMGHSSAYYWLNKNRAAAFFTAVPGGMIASEQNAWTYFGGGQKLWDELYDDFGVKAFPAGNTGTQMGGWFNRELKTIADIKGLKMRIPGIAGEVLNKMGGSAQVIPPQELFTSIQSGVIDALEWVGPWNDISLGFHRAAKYYYGPGFHEGGAMLELIINKKAFLELPKDLQQIVKVAAATENSIMHAEYQANNLRSFKTLRKEHKVDIRPYPKDIFKKFFEISKDVVSSVGNEGKINKKIYDSYMKFIKDSNKSANVTEFGFLKGRMGV